MAPADAVASGAFNRVPVINGANHDEGRTFAQGLTDLTQQQYEEFVRASFGADAAQVLARYPLSAFPAPYTSAYAIGAIWSDSGAIGGIGGCATLALTRDLARWTPTYGYQFDDRDAPGLNRDHPGYQWGAGHAMELAYMCRASTTASRSRRSSPPHSASSHVRWSAIGAHSRGWARRSPAGSLAGRRTSAAAGSCRCVRAGRPSRSPTRSTGPSTPATCGRRSARAL
jgi:carboxylesterase type B